MLDSTQCIAMMPRMINNDAKNDSERAISAAVSENIDQETDPIMS